MTETVRVLGVCGGIGSGKSTACKLLVDKCGCLAHIDADKVAHSVYEPGSRAVLDVVAGFGKEILVENRNGGGDDDDETGGADRKLMEIDRKKLGAIVFSDRSEMAKLEAIVWPHVKDRLADKIEELRRSWKTGEAVVAAAENNNNKNPIIVLEAAVLLDAGWDDLLDGVWVVTTTREAALKRLVETRGLTGAEASKRIGAQESRRGIGAGSLEDETNRGAVHNAVSNNGSLWDLEESLRRSLNDPGCWRKAPP